jgi:lipid A ethanolaminephosphotransferase
MAAVSSVRHHVLAQAISQLTAAQDRVDSALLFVSDHGESLGEKGLFLHGIPYAIAPDVQRKVPMVMWFSAGLDAAAGLKPGCLGDALRQQAGKTVSHDNLFHTVLGLVDVRTALHEPALDLTQACR